MNVFTSCSFPFMTLYYSKKTCCSLDVRLAAFECLVDFVRVDGKPEDLSSLLTAVEGDADPGVRHGLARLLVNMPPFEPAQRHRLDTEAVVHR